jgi:hypothetical protein
VFGYPITPARDQVNRDSGQRILTQWFERARFEWHPDEPDQYNVLLGLLGRTMMSRPAASSTTVRVRQC